MIAVVGEEGAPKEAEAGLGLGEIPRLFSDPCASAERGFLHGSRYHPREYSGYT